MSSLGHTLILFLAPAILLGAPFIAHLRPFSSCVSLVVRLFHAAMERFGFGAKGFLPLTPSQSPVASRRVQLCWQGLYGVLLGGGAVASALLLAQETLWAADDIARLSATLSVGAACGGAVALLIHYLRGARIAYRSVRQVMRSGVVGTWTTARPSPDSSYPFTQELIREATDTSSVAVIDADALALLTSLSHPAHGPLEAPHPCLHGTQLLLLVTPLRCQKVDPERRRSSCAEESLARLGRAPELHWQRLQKLEEVRNRWQEEFSTVIKLRYLEDRPCQHLVLTENLAWFQPWVADGTLWTEVSSHGSDGSGSLHSVLRDAFLNAWTDAPETPVYHEQPGSTFVKKQQEAPTGESLKLVESY